MFILYLNLKERIKSFFEKEKLTDKEVEKEFAKIFNVYLNDENNLNLKLENVTKVYENGIKAIDRLNLEIKSKEFVVFLGPSGCGKSTTLRMIAGLESISGGYLKFNNTIMNSSQPKNRKIAMVFQNYALYPFMTVFNNIAYGLKNKNRKNDVYSYYTNQIRQAKNSNYEKIQKIKAKISILQEGDSAKVKDEILELKRDLKTYVMTNKNDHISLTKLKIENLKKEIRNQKENPTTRKAILNLKQEIKQLNKDKKFDRDEFIKKIRDRERSVFIWKKYIRINVKNVTNMLGISDFLKRKPAELSGGQRQRVALARAISKKVNLYLYDEPLSNLDAKLRAKMRTEIRKIHDDLQATSVYVTHDQIEAMSMADKIVVIHKGYIQQVGAPIELINKPNNLFVANFIGNTNLNAFEVKWKENQSFVTENGGLIKIANSPLVKNIDWKNKKVTLAFRPEHVIVSKEIVRNSNENKFFGKVIFKELLGNDAQLTLQVEKLGDINILASVSHDFKVGDKVEFIINPNKVNLFDQKTGFNFLASLSNENQKAKEVWIEGEEERIKNNTLIRNQKNKLGTTEFIRLLFMSMFSLKAREKIKLFRDKTLSKKPEKIAK